ncbi:unnamed protein product [Lathyrus sativus]|nr:unnamed protein product [Lathyrus sativus]
MGSLVRVKEAVVVTPSEPTPACVMLLSSLDSQLFLRFTIEYLLVYRPSPGLDKVTTTARLKAALAKALVAYYPLAGRVRPSPNSTGLGLEVLCRAQGAIFIEAVSDRYTVNEFEKVPKTVLQWRKLLSLSVPDVLNGSPPLILQLTWLSDGGAALGVGINHCICDGIGGAEFLNYVADLASGKRGCPKPKPVWDRHMFNVQPTRDDFASHPEFNRVPDLCGFMNRVTNNLRPTCVIFDKRRLTELKGVARRTCQIADSLFTSFEVLAAHVWRSWARAVGFPPNQILKLLFSVNVRHRVKPGIPDGYYGNAIVMVCAQASARELGEKGIGYGSGLVKKAKERVDSEYVKRVAELVSESRASPDLVGVLILTQWSRMGLDRVELGMEKPVFVGPICNERYCLFVPVKGERDSVKVTVAVPATAFDNYHRFLRE